MSTPFKCPYCGDNEYYREANATGSVYIYYDENGNCIEFNTDDVETKETNMDQHWCNGCGAEFKG